MADSKESGERNAERRVNRDGKPTRIAASESEPELERREETEPGYFRKPQNWVSLLTLIFLGIYSGLTLLLWGSSQTAIEENRKNFRADERAYLFVGDKKDFVLHAKKGDKASWNIQYINYGKSPAVNEITDAHVWVGRDAVNKMNRFFDVLPTVRRGVFQDPPTNGQAEPHWAIVWSDNVVADDDDSFIRANDGGVVVAGRIWYYDVFGDPHYTDFCRYALVSGAISDCPGHTEIH